MKAAFASAPPARQRPVVLVLFIVAALYFTQGITASLDLTDEGCIIYPIWRVSEGAIPYRDFHQLYGPSLFFLNAALLRLFGADLLVVRIGLLVLKAIVATLVYSLASRVARWPFALIAYCLCVAVWGAPWWVFNAPYASYWAIAFTLAALLAFFSLHRRPPVAGFLAGLCFGIATTFKQTTGVFGFIALLLFLLDEPGVVASSVRSHTRAATGLGWLILFGTTGVIVTYLSPQLTSWSTLTLAAPIAVTVITPAMLALRTGKVWRPSVAVSSSVGMALPLAGYGAFYLWIGSFTALTENLVYRLPQRISRFVPLPAWGVHRPEWMGPTDPAGPELRMLLFAIVAISAAAAIRLWGRWRITGRPSRHLGCRCAVGVCLLATAGLLIDLWLTDGIVQYFAAGEWFGAVHRLFFWIPLLLVWASAIFLWSVPPANTVDRTAASRLLHVYATVGLVQLYPIADIWHTLMVLPIYLPLLAYVLDQLPEAEPARAWPSRQSWLAVLFSSALLVCLALPFVMPLIFAKTHRATQAQTLSRATGIWGSDTTLFEATELVDFLLRTTAPEQRVFAMTNQPAIYFLANRVSPLDDEEFALNLLGTGGVSEAAAREMIDDDRMLARLEASKPLLIDYDNSPATARFMATFPHTARFIAAHYRVVKAIGSYRVLRWSNESPGG